MGEKVILLVEDDPDDRELTEITLRESNIANRVVAVHDGVEALEYLLATGQYAGREPPLPQVVILDLRLPRLDGLEVLKRMRAHPRTRLIPVVVMTSSIQEEDLIASYHLGANSFMRKPLEFHRFAEAVRQLGMYWLLLNEPPPLRS